MSVNINFVADRQKRLKVQQEKDKPLLKKIGVFLAATFMLTGIILAIQIYFNFEKNQVIANQKKVQAAIDERKEVEQKYAIFFQKLSALTQLFGERQNKQEALAYFRNLFGDGVTVTGLTYNETDQELTFSLLSPSVFTLEKIFTTLNSEAVKNKYSQVVRHNLARSDNGSYSMQLTVKLKPPTENK